MVVNINYAAATIELYDLPLNKVTVYFTDRQEPGAYRTGCIGRPFVHFVDMVKAELGILCLDDFTSNQPGSQDLASSSDRLIVKWLQDVPAVPIPLFAQCLRLSPGTIPARRKGLRIMGYTI